jgi:CO/xanthine dehydrogenase Mo-binding subunit
MKVNGLTVKEIAEKLGLGQPAVKMRLRVAGIKPIGYAGPTALYPESALEAIRNVPSKGRPKKKPE